jgi:hypothetical protein
LRESPLADGGRMIWISGPNTPLTANLPMTFRFQVNDKDGHPARDMQPYMGMLGHAEFVRDDGSVFAHVHPAGSVSMAALELAQSALMPGSIDGTGPNAGPANPEPGSHAGMVMPEENLPAELSFPYGFPKPGTYRIFVQIKRAGRVETGVFDARVAAGKAKG